MANYFNHHRYRKRTYEYSQLKANLLLQIGKAPIGAQFTLNWTRYDERVLSRKFTKTEQGLTVTNGQTSYLIPLEKTQLTYGERLWYQCPACKRRSGVLYHAGVFACRACVKPSYRSQNGSLPDALANRIRTKRKRLWPELDACFIDDTLESCYWWPKPYRKHQAAFEREKREIVILERKLVSLYPERYRNSFAVTHYQ